MRSETKDVEGRHHSHRVGAIAGEVESRSEAESRMERAELVRLGSLTDGDESHIRDLVDDDARRGEKVGVCLCAPKVGNGTDHDVVSSDVQFGAKRIPGSVRGVEHCLDVDSVPHDLRRLASPSRHGVAYRTRNCNCRVVEAARRGVRIAGERAHGSTTRCVPS